MIAGWLLALLMLAACQIAVEATPTPASVVASPPTPSPTISPTPAPSPTEVVEPVLVGLLAPLTGELALQGKSARQGTELGIFDLNRMGGVLGRELGLQIVDSAGPFVELPVKFRELADRDSVFVNFSASSEQILRLTPMLRRVQVPTLTDATNRNATRQGVPWIVGLLPDDDRLARAAADFALQRFGPERIMVLYSNDEFGVGSYRSAEVELFDRFGIYVEEAVSLRIQGDDVVEKVRELAALKPTTTLVFARPALLGRVMRVTREAGLESEFITTSEATSNTGLAMLGDADVIGWYAATPPIPKLIAASQTQGMVDAYRNRFGGEPDFIAAAHYDGVGIAAEAIRRARSADPEPVLAALRTIAAYDGVLGRYVFTGDAMGLVSIDIVRFERDGLRLVERP